MFKEKLAPNLWLMLLKHSVYLFVLGFILVFIPSSNLRVFATILTMLIGYVAALHFPWLLFCTGFFLSLYEMSIAVALGTFLMISLPFYLSRTKGLDTASQFRKKPKKNYMIAQEIFRNGITWSLKNRTIATISFDDFNFAAGASKIRFAEYLLGSFLGLLLPLLIFPAFGHSMSALLLQQNWQQLPKALLLGIAAFTLSFIPLFYRHMEGWGSEQ